MLTAVLVACALFVGGIIQGSIGFGLGLVAAPIAMLLQPELIPGALALSVVPLTAMMIYTNRQHADLTVVRWALSGWLLGVPVGVLAILFLPPRETNILFGCLVLVAVGLSHYGLRAQVNRRTTFLAGAFGCFMNLTTTMGGPPMALLLQNAPGPQLVGTISVYFAFSSVGTLITFYLTGRLGVAETRHALWMIPCIMGGYVLSRWVAPHLHRGRTRGAVLLVAGLSGLILIIKTVVGYSFTQ